MLFYYQIDYITCFGNILLSKLILLTLNSSCNMKLSDVSRRLN